MEVPGAPPKIIPRFSKNAQSLEGSCIKGSRLTLDVKLWRERLTVQSQHVHSNLKKLLAVPFASSEHIQDVLARIIHCPLNDVGPNLMPSQHHACSAIQNGIILAYTSN